MPQRAATRRRDTYRTIQHESAGRGFVAAHIDLAAEDSRPAEEIRRIGLASPDGLVARVLARRAAGKLEVARIDLLEAGRGGDVAAASNIQKFSPVLLNSANAVFKNSLVRDCSVRRSAGGDAYIAALSGGGIRVINDTVANCTVVNCDASGDGGGIWASSANGKIINCIAWNNTCSGTGGKDIHAPSLPADKVTYTCAGDFGNDAAIATGTGCFATDPLFTHPERGDFRLRTSFPCREAGDNSFWTDISSVRDLAGNPRKTSLRVDMGCYETFDVCFIMILK